MISIVTPSYKQLDWLTLAIASVSDQTATEVEHIIQDAGSENVEKFFERTALSRKSSCYRPKLFVETDSGMYDAINRALRRARGDICAYLNCDEQYLPGTLNAVSTFFEANADVDVLFGDAILLNEDCVPVSYRRAIIPDVDHLRASHLPTLSCSMFFRRRIVDGGFLFNPSLKDVGDADWIERLLLSNIKMAALPRALGCFAFTGENRSALPAAREEGAKRAETRGDGLSRLSLVLRHRIVKAISGAYFPRRLKIDVFTPASKYQRVHMHRWVGFRWPG